MGAPVRAVMFDLDGTLLDTAADLSEAANRLFADLGLPPMSREEVTRCVGRGIPNLVKRLLTAARGCEPTSEDHAAMVEVFRAHYRDTNGRHARPFEGVIEGLDRFAAAGLPLACVTNKSAEFTEPLLEKTGLRGYFDLVVSGDTLANKKPHPEPLLHVCARFGIAPAEALLIGDSGNDIAAAREAGCRVFCVPYGYNEGVPVRAEDCDCMVSDLRAAADRVLPEVAGAHGLAMNP